MDKEKLINKLSSLSEEIINCEQCKLYKARNKAVPGSGNPEAVWMVVGIAPGAHEDEQGLPFVGRSGALLDKLIDESGWSRGSVYVTNIIKCRPPGNRDPSIDEIEACKPFLLRQIQLIQPLVITTLGKPAANMLLGNKTAIGRLRGQRFGVEGTTVVPTYHPSYILRGNNHALDLMREDFAVALALLMAAGKYQG